MWISGDSRSAQDSQVNDGMIINTHAIIHVIINKLKSIIVHVNYCDFDIYLDAFGYD